MLSLSFTPLLPWPVLAVLAAVALAMAVLAVLARGRMALLRTLVLALVLAALTNPALVREDREPVKDIAAVVIDRSASQALGDRPQVTDQVRAELQRRFGRSPRSSRASSTFPMRGRAMTARSSSRPWGRRSPTSRPSVWPVW